MPSIAIITLCVGADYKRDMKLGLESKRKYAETHGYAFHCDGMEVWDREKPIPWSKFHYLLKYLDNYDYIFWSDADAIILRQDLKLETHILPLLPPNKDLLWTYDACNHYNNGHMLIRGKSLWVRDYFKRCLEQNDLLYHIWWDNAAMIRLFETNSNDKSKIETLKEHWIMNSYVFGPKDTANDPSTRLYKYGDFLIHFAGVYSSGAICKLMNYALEQYHLKKELDPVLCDKIRNNN
jgi:hypothetical protein